MKSLTKEEINLFEKLLADFRQLQPWEKSPQTFLEITRFPHYELACSNILAFFLDPKEEHKFDDLLLKSLLEIYDAKAKTDFSKRQLQFEKIKREEPTKEGKYIDIMILAKPALIGIENKMNASAYNPFTEYSRHLEKVAKDEKIPLENIVKILLGLKQHNAGKDENYHSITFEEFFNQVSKNIGKKILKCEQRYLTFLIDFMNTIKNQQKDEQMDKELYEFLKRDGQEAATAEFYKKVEQFLDVLRSKVKKVSGGIPPQSGFDSFFWNSLKGNEKLIYDSLNFQRILKNDVKIQIQACIGIKGWEVAAYSVNGDWKKPENIPNPGPVNFDFNEPEEQIAKECQRLLIEVAKLA